MSARIRTAVIALLGVAAICAALLYVNRPAPALAKAGDCVTAPVNGSFQKASCGDASAKYQVLQIFAGQDANQCVQTAGTVEAVRETNGSDQSILCLGAHG
jgi:hypothetical protein